MFLGEVRLLPYTRMDSSWVACNGQLLSAKSYLALFNLIRNTYGGDGVTTFAVPNLNGRVAVGMSGPNMPGGLGTVGGSETVALYATQIPAHTHQLIGASTVADSVNPTTRLPAAATIPPGSTLPQPPSLFTTNVSGNLVPLNPNAMTPVGAGVPHENRQPFLALSYCIFVTGYYPSPAASEAP